MATARTSNDLIDAALRLLGVLGTTETAPAADTTLGLEALQDLLAEWSGDGLMVPSVTVSTFGLVNGQVAYRVGEGSMTLGTTLSGAAETQVDVGAGNI